MDEKTEEQVEKKDDENNERLPSEGAETENPVDVDQLDEEIVDDLIAAVLAHEHESAISEDNLKDASSDNQGDDSKKRKKKGKLRLFLKTFLALIEVFVLALVIFVASIVLTSSSKLEMISKFTTNPIGKGILHLVGAGLYENTFKEEEIKPEEIQTNKPKEKDDVFTQRYTTYVLFGIEGYTDSFDQSSHSDAIMLASVDKETKEVRIASVYRDTYLSVIDPHGEGYDVNSKVNSAYYYGGAVCAINTLNVNLDLSITDYATLNWGGVSTIIDAMGGVTVNLTWDEVSQLNYHMGATANGIGVEPDYVEQAGEQVLNGVQATTYCRIRKVPFYDPETGEEIPYDFGRAARQQFVVKQLVEKAKKADLGTIMSLAKTLLNNSTANGRKIFGSSLSFQEILELVPVLLEFKISDTYGFPETKTTPTLSYAGSVVVAADLAYNVELLHEFLYPESKNYYISDRVDQISTDISTETGVWVIERVIETVEDQMNN